MNKKEIEEIKRLLFQDRLTQYGKRKLIKYMEQLEFDVKALEMEHEHDVAMIDEVKGNAVKWSKEKDNLKVILDKVTDKLKQFKTDLKEHEEKYEYKKDISTGLVGVRINAILKIIEGEKK